MYNGYDPHQPDANICCYFCVNSDFQWYNVRGDSEVSNTGDYVKRLEALNGGPLRQRSAEGAPANAPPSFTYPRLPATGQAAPPILLAPHVALADVVNGVELEIPERGTVLLIERQVAELDDVADLDARYSDHVRRANAPLRARLAALCPDPAPDDLLFVDAETTGLGNAQIFLIGTMSWEADGLVVRQYFARDYAEEAALTHCFVEQVRGKRLLVSFNGKSFDLPRIRTRAITNAVPFPDPPPHLDLLHACRRVWRGELPNCRLKTLEQCICGRSRCGDIPGDAIPDAYHAYVHTANAFQIGQIVQHNMLDLVTLAELLTYLPA